MANRTVKDAKNVHGTNPQYLIEKIIRSRIYDSKYWKEQCFALTAELLVDKAMELRFVGGVFGGNIKPTPFLCLTLKMLQIQPEKDIVVEFIKNEEFKYVRALGAFYLRLTGSSLDCYKYLEPLYNDNRKLRKQNRMGAYELMHMDEFIDELLREERVCDIILPRIQKRHVLEENNELEPKVSALEDDLDEEMPSEDEAVEDLPTPPPSAKEKKVETEEEASETSGLFLEKDNLSIGIVPSMLAIIMIEKTTKNVDVNGIGNETVKEIGIVIAIETATERLNDETEETYTGKGIASKSVNFASGNVKGSDAMNGRRSVNVNDAEKGIGIENANTRNDPEAMTVSANTIANVEGDEINLNTTQIYK
uniref:Pre-mRNA-splicing factor 38 n=1 Tax=Anopheles christyi TaxID=43041 RepID=A0A182JRG1_9DIPT